MLVSHCLETSSRRRGEGEWEMENTIGGGKYCWEVGDARSKKRWGLGNGNYKGEVVYYKGEAVHDKVDTVHYKVDVNCKGDAVNYKVDAVIKC